MSNSAARTETSAESPEAEPANLPRWARALDAAACALVILALGVAARGGGQIGPVGFRVSVTSEWRVLAWAAALILLRHAIVRRPSLPERVVRGTIAAVRAPGPLIDDRGPSSAGGTEPQRRRPGRVLLSALGVVALYAALTAVMTYPQARFLTQTVVPDYGDPLLSTWRLAWIAHQLPRDPLRLFDANIFHPERNTLAFSDAMLVPALTVAPLVWLGVHPIVAYNILFLSGFALSGAAMFLLVRSLTGHAPAALLAGVIFAFLPYRYTHYSHLELQMAQWMPLSLWAFHKTVERGRLRDGLLTGAFVALQALSSWYYGIFFATYLAIVGTLVLIGTTRDKLRRAVPPLAAGAVLATLITLPFAMPYFAARRSVGERPDKEIRFYSATPENYRAAPYWNVMFGRSTHRLGGPERELFPGIAAPLVALVAFVPPLSAVRIAYALALAAAIDLSFGFNGFSYGWLHEYVLPFRGLRVPARMAIVVGLSLAILVGFGAARIARLSRWRWSSAAVLVLIGIGSLLEYRTTVRLRNVWPHPPPVYDAVRRQPASVLLELPLVEPDTTLEPIYMYFSTFHWQKLINGYSGFSPKSKARTLELLATFPDDASLAELRARGVNFVIVHGAFYRKLDDYEQIVARLNRRADVSLERVAKWQERESRVYRLLQPDPHSE